MLSDRCESLNSAQEYIRARLSEMTELTRRVEIEMIASKDKIDRCEETCAEVKEAVADKVEKIVYDKEMEYLKTVIDFLKQKLSNNNYEDLVNKAIDKQG